MKTSSILLSTVVIASAMLLTPSCKSKKETIQQTTGAKEITVPFSDKEYRSDEDYFRAKQLGKSPDLAAAKKIALQNAKSELASNIQTTIKKVTDQYTNQRTVGKAQEFENKFEELAREVTNQTISEVTIKGEKIFQEADGGYTYWVAIEANKKAVYNGLDAKISKDQKLLLDYDKQKFQQLFDDEMRKLSKEQGN